MIHVNPRLSQQRLMPDEARSAAAGTAMKRPSRASLDKRTKIMLLSGVFILFAGLLVMELLNQGALDSVEDLYNAHVRPLFGESETSAPPQTDQVELTTSDPAQETENAASAEQASEPETVEDGAELAKESALLNEPADVPLLPGVESNEKVLDALGKIASWRKTPDGYPLRTFIQYLVHRKLWVKLAALEFAYEAKAINSKQLQEVAADIRRKHETSQIRRFLERARFRDATLWVAMRKLLAL